MRVLHRFRFHSEPMGLRGITMCGGSYLLTRMVKQWDQTTCKTCLNKRLK